MNVLWFHVDIYKRKSVMIFVLQLFVSGISGVNKVNNPGPNVETRPECTTGYEFERQSDSRVRHEIFQLVANKHLIANKCNRWNIIVRFAHLNANMGVAQNKGQRL